MAEKKDRINEIGYNNNGERMTIVRYGNKNDIDVQFEDGTIVEHRVYCNFKKGKIKNPMTPNVYGVGFIGIGDYKSVYENGKHVKCYDTWESMHKRCYDPKYQEKHQTYKGCTVCQLWNNYQEFAKWDKENYYEVGNERMDLDKDILKIAVIERHKNTGHIGLGFITGIGLKKGAIASSVSHDSHNLIVVGASESDMTVAANRIKELGGGYIVVVDGKILAELPLPIGGIMTDASAAETARKNKELRDIVSELGVSRELNPFMNMAFSALSVIPHLKMTTLGLVDVDKQQIVPVCI